MYSPRSYKASKRRIIPRRVNHLLSVGRTKIDLFPFITSTIDMHPSAKEIAIATSIINRNYKDRVYKGSNLGFSGMISNRKKYKLHWTPLVRGLAGVYLSKEVEPVISQEFNQSLVEQIVDNSEIAFIELIVYYIIEKSKKLSDKEIESLTDHFNQEHGDEMESSNSAAFIKRVDVDMESVYYWATDRTKNMT